MTNQNKFLSGFYTKTQRNKFKFLKVGDNLSFTQYNFDNILE
jgi:hypothetical protein